ncbi:MAG: C39 family peptidase [Alphaproteobacteria bacterium]|nr:C39 family peptidase [Alphaproteobacteria bacterium]
MTKGALTLSLIAGLALAAALPAQAQAEKRKSTGAVLLAPAKFKSLPTIQPYRAYLPPRADLSAWFPAPGEQGDQPSCTAWATGYALRSYYANRLSTSPKVAPAALSPAFIYNQLTEPGKSCSQGLAVPTALDFLKKTGVAPMTAFSYNEKSCDQRPSPEIVEMAGSFRIDDWKTVNPRRLDDIKGEIANGNPVVVAMHVTKKFETYVGEAPFDDTTWNENTHAMVLVGYDEQKRSFRLINSWGDDWGDKGYGWLSYRTFSALVPEAYTVRLSQEVPAAPLSSETVEITNAEEPNVLRLPPKPESQPSEPPLPVPVKFEPVEPEPLAPAPLASNLTPPQPAAPPAVEAIQKLGKQLKCAGLESSKDERGVVHVSGFVATEADRDRVFSLVDSGASSQKTELDIQVEPWPLCEARQTFNTPLSAAQGLSLKLRDGNAEQPLKSGQKISLEVTTPDFPSYLYVSYIQVDGQVVHLHRYRDSGKKPLAPGTRLVLGGAGELRIGGPRFGNEVVVAIASPLPLLALDRVASETERDYLTEFRQAILSQQAGRGQGAVAASMLRLTTKP